MALANPTIIPDPQPLPPTGNCIHDNIFYGAIPEEGEESRVLVFVHGLSGIAEDWWSANTLAGLNDMYIEAYNAGYRTAFVNLNINLDDPNNCAVERRPAHDMMKDGVILNEQIKVIRQHYATDQVDIISHSKGGIDAQAAIIWQGTWQWVGNLFTIATPHQGNLLADLLWSPEGVWISILLGQRDDATKSLTTASMQVFRAITDESSVDDTVHYYSGAGNFWQTPNSLFEVTGEWLQNHQEGGDNDGVVRVASTYLPEAVSLFLEAWNHNETYIGRNAFPYIHQILLEQEMTEFDLYLPLIVGTGNQKNYSLKRSGENQPGSTSAKYAAINSKGSNYILRGGLVSTSITEVISIESEVHKVNFSLLGTNEKIKATLFDANDTPYSFTEISSVNNHGILHNVFSRRFSLNQPVPGQWRVRIDSPLEAGYLLIVTLDSQLHIVLDGLPTHPLSPGETVHFKVKNKGSGGKLAMDQMFLRIANTTSRPANGSPLEIAAHKTGSVLNYTFDQEGIYGLSITINGHTMDGFSFERSFISSLAIVSSAACKADLMNMGLRIGGDDEEFTDFGDACFGNSLRGTDSRERSNHFDGHGR